MDFYTLLDQVVDLLRQRQRVTYRALQRQFDLDEETLTDLKNELLYAQQVTRDEDGRVLIWTGSVDTSSSPPSPSAQHAPQLDLSAAQTVQREPSPSVAHMPEAERRQLTVLFCDLVDSTRLARQLDPEDYREVVRAYQQACAEIIQHFDGHIAQYLGDGLLVYFGYPQAHEDDAQCAVRTGLDIVGMMGTLNARLERDKGLRLTVRVGIHTGLVVVGGIGGSDRQEQLALGDTPNIAARLQGLAAPDTVVISEATARLVQGFFTCQALGAQDLKGLDQPLSVYRVLHASGRQTRLDVATPRGLTPLVGREQEVGLLLERWAQVKDSMGQVVFLTGEAGIGKSRLVQVLREQILGAAATCIECRCLPHTQHSALRPVITHWERSLAFAHEDTPDAKLRKLEDALAAYALPLSETVPLFAALLSLPLPARDAPVPLMPQRQRQQTLEALLTWLVQETEQHPVLCIVEDLHWVDPSTLEFLVLLLDQVPTARLLLLLTARPEFKAPWGSRAYLTQLTLGRLGRSQVEAMVTGVLHGKPLPVEVLQQVVAKTDGVPLFVEEQLKMVLESELVREVDGRYVLTGLLPPLAIPATLQDALMARLDRLASAKIVAQLGATIGRQFTYDLLQAVCPLDTETLQAGLRQLVEAELLYQRGLPPQATYLFKHVLIQEAAYQSLLKSTRQQYHQRIAQVLAERLPDRSDLLAHHAWCGAQWDTAARAFQEAGSQALARSAYPEAVACFDQALAALRCLPQREYQETCEQVITILFGLRGALVQLGDLERALVVLHEAETLAQTLDDPHQLGRVSSYMARYCFLMGEHDVARAASERALRLATDHQDFALQVTAHMYLGQVYHALGQYPRALEVLGQNVLALTDDLLYEHFGMANLPIVTSRTFLTYCLAEQGAFEEGRMCGAEGMRIAETAAHANSLAIACLGSGRLALNAGDLPQAITALERGLHLCQSAHIALLFSTTAAALGYAYVLAGRVPEALLLLEQVQQTAPLPSPLSSLVLVWLGEIARHAGRLESAHGLAEHALKLAQERQERGNQAWALHLLGTLALWGDLSQAAQAHTYYEQARSLADELGMRPLQAHCHMGLGRLCVQLGQAEQARAALSTAIDLYHAMQMTFWLPQTEAALAQVQEPPP